MAALRSRPFSVNWVSSSLTGRRLGLTLGLAALSGVLFALVLPRGATTQLQRLSRDGLHLLGVIPSGSWRCWNWR